MRKQNLIKIFYDMNYAKLYVNKFSFPYLTNSNLYSLFLCVVIIGVPISCILFGYNLAAYLGPPPSYFPAPGVIADLHNLNYSLYNTHNLTIGFYGRLGNQLFQYASMYGIAKANGFIPYIKNNNMLRELFTKLKSKVTNNNHLGKKYDLYHERKSNAFDQRTFSLNFMKNIILDGFFQSWRYFDHVRSDIRSQFIFNEEISVDVDTFFKTKVYPLSNHLKDPVYVGVHVRRGDFLSEDSVKKGYSVSDLSYIQRAMRYFEIKFKELVFIIVSDDIVWCINSIASETSTIVFSTFHDSAYRDLCLLSRTNHSIITGGTFGWWGAYLAAGQVVYDKNYPEPLSKLRDNYRLMDYYVNSWKGL